MDGVPDYIHPTEINGRDKQHVASMIMENTPQEYIKGIFTPQEYMKFIETDKFKNLLVSFFPNIAQNPKAMINYINSIKNNILGMLEEEKQMQQEIPNNFLVNQPPKQQLPKQQPQVQKQQVKKPSQVKYYTDGGVQFKLEDGQLYKKVWENVILDPYTNEQGEQFLPEIRLINLQTGKPMKTSKFGVQKLVWKKLE